MAVVGASVGFGVWLRGARPGIRGAFEGERDWSLLYADLPVMVLGVPAVALAVLAAACATLRGRVGRSTQAVVAGTVLVLTLAALAWAGTIWLDARVAPWVEGAGAHERIAGPVSKYLRWGN